MQVFLPAATYHESNLTSVLRPRGGDKTTHYATPTEVKRHKVLALLEYGLKPSAICAKMGYSPDLVRKVDRLRKSGQGLTPNFKGGERTIRSPEFMRKLEQIFKDKPEQSFRKTARDLGVCHWLVVKSAKELGFKSFRQRFRALLTTQIKTKRMER